MKWFVEVIGRDQATPIPKRLMDWIDVENPVRAINAFIDDLDLGDMGFACVDPKTTGRPGYHPSALLKLDVYCYLNAVQSSRRLEHV